MTEPARPAPVPDVSIDGPAAPGANAAATCPTGPLPPFDSPEFPREWNRVHREWVDRVFPGGVTCPPSPPPDGTPHPTLRRRPRDPWVPKPPPHLDPDLTEAQRRAAYKELTGCDPPVWY